MKLRLLLSLFLIVAVSTTAFASTKALLSDQVTLTANTFSTGTVDLQISKSTSSSPSSFTDITLAGFTGKVVPGQTTSQPIWLKNLSSDVDLDVAAQVNVADGATVDPSKVTLSFTPVNNDGSSSGGTTVSHTLSEWSSVNGLGSTLLRSVNTGRQRYSMDIMLAPDVITTGTISFDVVFTGTEVIPTATPTGP